MSAPESRHSPTAASAEAARLPAAPSEREPAAEGREDSPADLLPPVGEAGPSTLLSRSDQLIVGLLCAAALVLSGVRQYQVTRQGQPPATLVRSADVSAQLTLEINTASWVEWMQLEGIGETLARRIVADRETAGPFASIDDLQRVRGIGPKTVERLRPWLRESPASANAVPASGSAGPVPPSR